MWKIALSCLLVVWGLRVAAQTDSVAMRVQLDDVTVTARSQTVSMPDNNGNTTISTELIHKLPRTAGAVDLVKLLQFTPGVMAVTDGGQGIFVRGSDIGQNRMLLNGAPVYTTSHLLGLFSVFNTPYVGGLSLMKSNIPAQYGSTLSSVTDVRTSMSIPKRTTVEANVGLIESDIAARVRISDRVALMGTARHSYASWLTSRLLIKRKGNELSYEFGDYALGLVVDLGSVGQLVVNSHFNHDRALADFFSYDSDGVLRLRNSSSSAQLRTYLGERTTMENVAYATLYDSRLDMDVVDNGVYIASGIKDFGLRNVTTSVWQRLTLTIGGEYACRIITPQTIHSTLTGGQEANAEPYPTSEMALYGSVRWTPHRHFELDAGLRISLFAGERVWVNPEPRVMIAVPFDNDARVWAVYNRTVQYLQYVPQSNTGIATDFIVAATSQNPPQKSNNFSVGYSQAALRNRLRWSVELFYRQLYGVVENKTNISIMLTGNQRFDETLLSGIGEAYGAELGVGYTSEKVDVQLNYTLSRSLRKFSQMNGGRVFPSHSDRPHNLSAMVIYTPAPRWSFGATFLYATGEPYTAPKSIYMVGGAILKEYGPYNGARLPQYHRLDLSATYWMPVKTVKRFGINLSVYNVYSRSNPQLISWPVYYDKADHSIIHIEQRTHSLFSLIPSLSLTVKF
ncbi:MAG: TonB-dependent receptor plug domain-containing protein [Alistipes sp.]|nr:TonB-dependent receptor plug domain-containing protein [Alistipes sp.]